MKKKSYILLFAPIFHVHIVPFQRGKTKIATHFYMHCEYLGNGLPQVNIKSGSKF